MLHRICWRRLTTKYSGPLEVYDREEDLGCHMSSLEAQQGDQFHLASVTYRSESHLHDNGSLKLHNRTMRDSMTNVCADSS